LPLLLAAVLLSNAAPTTAWSSAQRVTGPSLGQVTKAFESLLRGPSATTVQGFDPALASALQASTAANGGNYPGLLAGTVRVFGAQMAGPGVATVDFGLGDDGFASRFVGTAVAVDGTWHVSWVTVCMLVEDQGTACPPAPAGVVATVPLPYSVTARQQLAGEPAGLVRPEALAAGPDGSLLIVDADRDQVLQRWPDGQLAVFAGTGQPGFSGDGGPARAAQLDLDGQSSLALGPDGAVYIADAGNNRLRRVSPAGTISTVGHYPGVSGVAVSPSGTIYIATGGSVERLGPSGEPTVLACFSFQGSSCPPGRSRGIPKGMGFSPALLAFEGDGDLVVWSNGPRELYRMTPTGALTDLGADYIAGLAPAPDGSVLLAEHGTAVGRVTGGHVEDDFINLVRAKLKGYAPGTCGSFQADGVAATGDGAVFVDTFIGNGWTCDNGLVEVGPNGQGRELAISTPVLVTLPMPGSPGFPIALYPPRRPALGTDLPACPGAQGLEPFTPETVTEALAVAGRFNAFVSSFYGDLRSTDRAWWPSVFDDWVSNFYDNDTHTVVSHGPAFDDLFSAAVAHACGKLLLRDSIVVVVGPSGYSSQVSHLYFLDRRGQPLIYFQDQ
jgi:hypothetical protein